MALPLQKTQITTIPAPVGGWNARDPLAAMPPSDAVELINMFPDSRSVKKRNGYRRVTTAAGSGNIETLINFDEADGGKTLIACGSDNKIYTVTTGSVDNTASETTKVGTPTITEQRWQYTQFGSHVIMVNGTNAPLYIYDDSGTVKYSASNSASAAFTAPGGGTLSDAVNISSYKSRVYLVPKDSQEVWYGGVDSTAGALTKFDLQYELSLGGHIVYAGSATRNIGATMQNLWFALSSEGEIFAYQGDYPGSATWSVVGQFFIPKPLGRRSVFHLGADAHIITELGIVPLSTVLSGQQTGGKYAVLTDKIDREFVEAAKYYGSNEGWEAVNYPRGNFLLINVPVAANSEFKQYVMNTITGAWCEFYNITSCSWALHDGKIYFGSNNGAVYEADYGTNDNLTATSGGVAILARGMFAYNHFGRPHSKKHFKQIRPLIQGLDTVSLSYKWNTDFKNITIPTPASYGGTAGVLWDEGAWDTADWAGGNVTTDEWENVPGLGYFGALRFAASVIDAEVELIGLGINFEEGGVY